MSSTQPKPGVSTSPRAMAADAMKLAERAGKKGADAVAHARKYGWASRYQAVTAGDTTLADTWLDALAELGDPGGLTARAERAKAAVKGDRA